MPRVPESKRLLSRELGKIRDRANDGTNFAGTGIHFPEPGVVQVDGNLWVTGDFTADGKIGNDALTDPVVPVVARNGQANFPITTTDTVKATFALTVPANRTQLMLLYTVAATALNGSGGTSSLIVSPEVVRSDAGAVPAWISHPGPDVASGGLGESTFSESDLLTGLTPGSTVTVRTLISAAFATWPTNAINRISTSALGMWLR